MRLDLQWFPSCSSKYEQAPGAEKNTNVTELLRCGRERSRCQMTAPLRLKADRKLPRDRVSVLAWTGILVLEAVLQLQLRVRGEAVADGGIDPPYVAAPGRTITQPITHGAENLLIPTQSPIELRREFVSRLKVVGEDIGVTHGRNFEARFEKLSPNLKVAPGKRDVLCDHDLPVVVKAMTCRQRALRLGSKVGAGARGGAKGPHLVGMKTEATAESRVLPLGLGRIPSFRPGGKRRVF